MPSFCRAATSVLLASVTLLSTGCSFESANVSPEPFSPAAVTGRLMGGHQPITGATVSLYAATSGDGTTTFNPGDGAAIYGGYAGQPILLGTATTEDSTGTHGAGYFSITRNGNVCQDGANDQVYIVSNSGNPTGGLASNTAAFNTAAVLVAALGTCNAVTSSTVVAMNEGTTIAAAYALDGFAEYSAGNSVRIGTSTTNKLGLVHAFANARQLADSGNGLVSATTPGGNGTINQTVINAVANALAQCVNSTGAASPSCSSMFVAYPVPNSTATRTPSTTWQLALNIAAYPAVNVSAITTAAMATPQFFIPTLAAQPVDFSAAIAYTAKTNVGSSTVAFNPFDVRADNNDNIWLVTSGSAGLGQGLVELNSLGVQQPTTLGNGLATSAGLRSIAIETGSSPRVWVGDMTASTVYVYSPSAGTTAAVTVPGTVTYGGNQTDSSLITTPSALAIDGSNNVFYATSNNSNSNSYVGEIPYSASSPVAKTVYTNDPGEGTYHGSTYMALDASTGLDTSGYVYAPSQANGSLVWTYPTTPTFTGSYTTATPTAGTLNFGVAFDGLGSAWVVTQAASASSGQFQKCTTAGGGVSSCATAITAPTGATTGLQARAIAIDGNGRLFLGAFTSPTTVVEYDTVSGYLVNSTSTTAPGYQPTGPVRSNPRALTIDHSGALWVANGGSASNPVVLQMFGIAAPVDPVLADGKYGVRP